MARVYNNGTTQFHLPPTHEPYLPLLSSRKASPPFSWYSLRLPTKGWPSWVDLGGCSHSEINVRHRELNPYTVTHPSTNRAQCRLTSLIETNALPLRQTTTVFYDVRVINSIQNVNVVLFISVFSYISRLFSFLLFPLIFFSFFVSFYFFSCPCLLAEMQLLCIISFSYCI